MRGALALLVLVTGSVEAMMYRPPAPFAMWDTWVFRDGDEYHLFFLQSHPPRTWDTIGRAVSTDLMHWTALPPIPTMGPAGAWDEPPSLTGCTVRDGDRVVTFYGSAPAGVQSIGAMIWQPDLRGWVKHPDNPLLLSRGPHYSGGDWRDLAVYREADGTWYAFCCARSGGDGVEVPALGQKTMVAWVTIDDLASRGGSVLTVEEAGSGRFDALVYGERAEGRWHVGSEGFGRTPSAEEIAASPEEDAAPERLVQMAAVYAGRRVSLYRDGELYSVHDVAEPLTIDSGLAVVLGLRHTGAGRPACFFAGGIADARLYSEALTAGQLRALKPGQPSRPEPLAWFDFARGAVDQTGRFPEPVLHGGAKVADGRLRLDGIDDYLITPANPGGEAAVAYLTSRDLYHWDYHEPAYVNGDYFDMEVPDYFELGGRHYLVWSSLRTRRDVGGRRNASGCWYVVGESRLGPYAEPADPLLLPSGEGRFDNYVARTIDHVDGRLCYHHTVGGDVCWAEPKLIHQNPDGTLELHWWPRLSALETEVLIADGAAELDGPRLEPLGLQAADAMITARIAVERGSAGLAWRLVGEAGVQVRLNPGDGSVAVERRQAGGAVLIDRVTGVLRPGPHEVRVMVRAHRASVYVDDRWLFGLSLPEGPSEGDVAMLCDGAAAFASVRVARLEPLP